MKKGKLFAVLGISACMLLGSVGSVWAGEAEPVQEGRYALSFDEGVVEIESGQILGYMYDDVYTYLGIPYAHAERFKAPEKPEPWEGIKSCLTYKEICPQVTGDKVGNEKFFTKAPLSMETQNEDCQFLNVWTTDLTPEAPKAVMVFFHGGGYFSGSATECVAQDLTNMAKYGDIVAVSINHRLNSLGFMDVSEFGEEYKYSANAGVQDMVAALQWVKDNISVFGGDPENVTIFGQSGGGGKVCTLLGTPAAQGLFQKAICMSGGVATRTQEAALNDTHAIMDILGFTTVEELAAVDYDALMAAAAEAGASWGPTIDGDYYPACTFDYENEIFTPLADDIPFMIGTTFGEFSSNGVPIVGEGGQAQDTSHYTEEEVMQKLEEKYAENGAGIAEEFRKAYPDHDLRDVLGLNGRAWNREQYNGIGFALGKDSEWMAVSKSKTSNAPVYCYVFAYTYPIFGGVTATHGADLAFAFHDVELFKHLTLNDPAVYTLQDQVASAWINFAKTGDPSQEDLAWEPLTAENGATMIFDVNSEVRYFHDRELMELIATAPSSSGTSAADEAEPAEEAEIAETAEETE